MKKLPKKELLKWAILILVVAACYHIIQDWEHFKDGLGI